MARYGFVPGSKYTRGDVFNELGFSDPKGGDFYTGYAEFVGRWFIFCGIGTTGRTGHDYGNHFAGEDLVWYGKTNSAIHQNSIKELISPGAEVYIFFRTEDRAPFTFWGLGRAKDWKATRPVEITWQRITR